MRHEIRVSGHRYALRPVEITDAETILVLRSDPKLNAYLHATPPRLDAQIAWLARYFDRPGDWYFVVTDGVNGRAEGFVGVYDFDPERRTAEWGRWILRKGSLAAAESALLIYRVGFEVLDLNEMYCRTVSRNRAVVSFHDNANVPKTRIIKGCFNIAGRVLDAVEHRLDSVDWPATRQRLDRVAALAARLDH